LEYEDLSSLSVSMRVAPRDADGKTKAMTSSQRGNHFLSFLPNFASFSSQVNPHTLSPETENVCAYTVIKSTQLPDKSLYQGCLPGELIKFADSLNAIRR
jgi:hypothetical protein